MPISPRLCLLGDNTETPTLTRSSYSVVMVGIASAARMILRHWKSPVNPTMQEWKLLMSDTASYEVMLPRIRGKEPGTMGICDNFMIHLTSN